VVRTAVDVYDELEPAQRAGFDEDFVVRTRSTARRYREHVVAGTTLVDEAALARIFAVRPLARRLARSRGPRARAVLGARAGRAEGSVLTSPCRST